MAVREQFPSRRGEGAGGGVKLPSLPIGARVPWRTIVAAPEKSRDAGQRSTLEVTKIGVSPHPLPPPPRDREAIPLCGIPDRSAVGRGRGCVERGT